MGKTIAFFHPDLGIGGAERLVVDAAVGLQELGYRVVILTSHCDPRHCFDEARDGTLDVRVRGNLLPRSVGGRFHILFAILRHYHLLAATFASGELPALQASAFFVDQLSAGIPLLRLLYRSSPVLFYCHFPDLLLVQRRREGPLLLRLLRSLWRLPFDALEGWSMRAADRVVVNSRFTRRVATGVWKDLGGKRGVGVVYPCVDTDDDGGGGGGGGGRPLREQRQEGGSGRHVFTGDKKILLSINRFEVKKNIDLAIKAFARLDRGRRKGARLVIAGGYDTRVQENVSYLAHLTLLATSLGIKAATAHGEMALSDIQADVEAVFCPSVPAELKSALLRSAKLLIYTPTDEHFGIVPLEAMLAGVPVLATNTGGPLETVVDGETGWLRDPERVEDWAAVMDGVLSGSPTPLFAAAELERMGAAGRERVRGHFSRARMAARLDEEMRRLVAEPRAEVTELGELVMGAVAAAVLLAAVWLVVLP